MVTSPLQSREYDIVVIGTGIGGATLGYALSRPGRSILFVEQGKNLSAPESLRGLPAEASPEFASGSTDEQSAILRSAGRSPEWVHDLHNGDRFRPYIGFGTGGSSSLYGMVLERRYPHDFEHWPIAYDELAPWYDRAESLYEVTGTPDPLRQSDGCSLRPPPPLSPANDRMFKHLRQCGLHPYRLHLASRLLAGCNLCQGYLCSSSQRCKNDARTTCLEPALEKGDTHLMTETRVEKLALSGRRVTALHARTPNGPLAITARTVVLAAGALGTPRLLLASEAANSSGLVGRRLMRHAIDLFVLACGPRYREQTDSKELACNDYYAGSDWLGTVQSFGTAPPLAYLKNQPGPNLWKLLGPAAVPVSKVFAGAPIMAGILEDKPSEENRVEFRDGSLRIAYRLSPADSRRRARFRRSIWRAFARFAPVPVFGTADRKALGHVCGTAVFGDNPATSVLDRYNRAHDLDNLYVVDASFFPTSGGTNPALTIAANALRVANHLEQVM